MVALTLEFITSGLGGATAAQDDDTDGKATTSEDQTKNEAKSATSGVHTSLHIIKSDVARDLTILQIGDINTIDRAAAQEIFLSFFSSLARRLLLDWQYWAFNLGAGLGSESGGHKDDEGLVHLHDDWFNFKFNNDNNYIDNWKHPKFTI